MKSKDILVFLIAVGAIALGVFGISRLLSDDNGNSILGGEQGGQPGDEEEEVYIPTYLSTEEALTIANDLYTKAETIVYDPLSYSEYKFDGSDRDGYANKITNFTYITSNIFKDINKAITKEYELDSETGILYINNVLKDKDKFYIGTELQLRENDEDRIAFNAISTYCKVDNRPCTEEERIVNDYSEKNSFVIVKHNGIWKADEFILPY